MTSFSGRGGGVALGSVGGGWGASRARLSLSGGSQRSGSVYGGAGGKGTRISSSSAFSASGGGFAGFGAGGGFRAGGGFGAGGGGGGGLGFGSDGIAITVNEKQTLQNLNDRLGRYLERVRTLEEANAKLELQIKQWTGGHVVVATRDLSSHQAVIDELRGKIMAAVVVVAELVLQVDNTKLAANDLRIKYDSEHGLRQIVEADAAGLKRFLGELTLVRSDLELQVEGAVEELAYLKKNHEEETLSFHTQLSGQVQVEVDAAPAVDLTTAIAEIREQYEMLVSKNRREVEHWFQNKVEVVQVEVKSSTEVLQNSSVELKNSQSTLCSLEVELQSMHSMKASLEANLAETAARYGAMLLGLQASVSSLEQQLVQIRADTDRSGEEYRALLHIKTRLEMEIAEYRRLLEGGVTGNSAIYTSISSVETSGSLQSSASYIQEASALGHSAVSTTASSAIENDSSNATIVTKVITVVQELVDGEVVSSSTTATTTTEEATEASPVPMPTVARSIE